MQFLHIGKTGGSFVRAVVNSLPPEHRAEFRLLHHDAKLTQALETRPHMPVFFSVRRPETLFASAFNSRLRMGRPTYDRTWSSREEIAFSVFETPNQLAEALSSEDPYARGCAQLSMFAINHVRQGLRWYLVDVANLERHHEDIAFVLLQERLEDDLRAFAARVGIPLESSEVFGRRVHADEAGDTTLSETALANLREWYRTDLEIYDWCVKFHDRLLDGDRG